MAGLAPLRGPLGVVWRRSPAKRRGCGCGGRRLAAAAGANDPTFVGGGGAEGVTDALRKHLAPENPRGRERKAAVLTTRAEALGLYRTALRASRLFGWRDEAGAPWAERLRASCRQEFEQARHETDPALISRMLIVGRDAVDQTLERYRARAEQLLAEEQRRGDGGDGGGGPRGK